ncbi:hypothetical protein [Janibacter sp. DB-40]|uniref:hypothetical protein n=1 Tax=Janibacter sp. DB-40 TaxID=3028808 RepID=UPI002406EFDF|nr:hypothetical protein [Janibacter sp. DB-40]
MTRTRTLAATATAAVLALTLSACSDDSDSSPSGSTSSSSGSSTSQQTTSMKDRSSQIFEAAQEPQALGAAKGTVNLGIGFRDREHVIFEVTDVRVTTDATILRYQLTAQQDAVNLAMEGRFWFDQPTLQAPGSDTKLQTVTASIPEGKHQRAQERCVCTSIHDAGPDPRSQTAMYPPLPKDATKVKVTLPGLDPVTVPITR